MVFGIASDFLQVIQRFVYVRSIVQAAFSGVKVMIETTSIVD